MRIALLLYCVLAVSLGETVIEDEISSQSDAGKVIPETKSGNGSSSASATNGTTDCQKIVDEKIVDAVFKTGTKNHALGGQTGSSSASGAEGVRATSTTGMSHGEIRHEESGTEGSTSAAGQMSAKNGMISGHQIGLGGTVHPVHHSLESEKLKILATVNSGIHQQLAASQKMSGDHILSNQHVIKSGHHPMQTQVMTGQHLKHAALMHTAQMGHGQIVNHQIGAHLAQEHLRGTAIHHSSATSGVIVNPNAPHILHHKLTNPMLAGHSVTKLSPIHSPIIPETTRQLAAIRLINQQLREAMIQNQQAALVGLQIQHELEVKDRHQKIMATQHHMTHKVPILLHESPIVKHNVHLINHNIMKGQQHAAMAGEQLTSVNKHALSQMRHMAEEMHSARAIHMGATINHHGEGILAGKAVMGKNVGESVAHEAGKTEGKAEKISVTAEMGNTADVHTEGKVLHEIGKEIADASTGMKTAEIDAAKKSLHADKSMMNSGILKKNIAEIPVVENEKILGKEQEKDGLLIKAADKILKEKSLKEQEANKKVESALVNDALIKQGNVMAEKTVRDISALKKTELAIAEGDKNKEMAMKELGKTEERIDGLIKKELKEFDTMKKSESAIAEDVKIKNADSLTGQTMKESEAVKQVEAKAADAKIEEKNFKDVEVGKKIKLSIVEGAKLETAKETEKLKENKEILVKGSEIVDAIKNADKVAVKGGAVLSENVLKESEAAKKSEVTASKMEEKVIGESKVRKLPEIVLAKDAKIIEKGVEEMKKDKETKDTFTKDVKDIGAVNKNVAGTAKEAKIEKNVDVTGNVLKESAQAKKLDAELAAVKGDEKILKEAETDKKPRKELAEGAKITGIATEETKMGKESIVKDTILKKGIPEIDVRKNEADTAASEAASKRDSTLQGNILKESETVKKVEAEVASAKVANQIAETVSKPETIFVEVENIVNKARKEKEKVKETKDVLVNEELIKKDTLLVPELEKIEAGKKDTASIAGETIVKGNAALVGKVLKKSEVAETTAAKMEPKTLKQSETRNKPERAIADVSMKTEKTVKKLENVRETKDVTSEGQIFNKGLKDAVTDTVIKDGSASDKILTESKTAKNVGSEIAVAIATADEKTVNELKFPKKTESSAAEDSVIKEKSGKNLEETNKSKETLVADEAIKQSEILGGVLKDVDEGKKDKEDIATIKNAKVVTDKNLGESKINEKAGSNIAAAKVEVKPAKKLESVNKTEGKPAGGVTFKQAEKLNDKTTNNLNIDESNKESAEAAVIVKEKEADKIVGDFLGEAPKILNAAKKTDNLALDDKASKPAADAKNVPKPDKNVETKKLQIQETPKETDSNKDVVNDKSKNGKVTDDVEINLKNTKNKVAEEKINVLQKNVVDERMARGDDIVKDGPVFTSQGSVVMVASDKESTDV